MSIGDWIFITVVCASPLPLISLLCRHIFCPAGLRAPVAAPEVILPVAKTCPDEQIDDTPHAEIVAV